jgi:hypothetical protein
MTNLSKLAYTLGALVICSFPLWGQVETVSVPDLTRIDPVPRIDPIQTGKVPTLETTPTIEMKPSIETTPRLETEPRIEAKPLVRAEPSRVVVPPTPPRTDSEAPDCTVRELRCARSCEPLPDMWSSYRACVVVHCEKTEESCIEKLVEELRSRHTATESTITFNVKSDYQYAVRVEFFSQERNLAWPGSHDTYKVDDYQTHSYRLRCSSGEKICYGASDSSGSTYWGLGLDGRHGCKNCCAVCGGNSVSYVLK